MAILYFINTISLNGNKFVRNVDQPISHTTTTNKNNEKTSPSLFKLINAEFKHAPHGNKQAYHHGIVRFIEKTATDCMESQRMLRAPFMLKITIISRIHAITLLYSSCFVRGFFSTPRISKQIVRAKKKWYVYTARLVIQCESFSTFNAHLNTVVTTVWWQIAHLISYGLQIHFFSAIVCCMRVSMERMEWNNFTIELSDIHTNKTAGLIR